jgi:hypothetical protein
METAEDKLETLIAKVRALPKERQELALEALSEIADEEAWHSQTKRTPCSSARLSAQTEVNLRQTRT